MHEYYLFNHAAIVAMQGSTLTFHATNDSHAIELGKGYAQKLGWQYYSVVLFDGEEELTIYEIRRNGRPQL